MNVLFWVPPWPVNGDYEFVNNAAEKHLMKQANILTKIKDINIDFIVPYQISHLKDKLNDDINIIELPFDFSLASEFLHRDIYSDFYQENQELIKYTCEQLQPYLSNSYDVILLWETPVPFLETSCPDALIVHQMPGFFSRPPYPHTVIFDTEGLYKRGFIAKYPEQIQRIKLSSIQKEVVSKFQEKSKSMINSLQPYKNFVSMMKSDYEDCSKLTLLPLQTSNHYAFKVDTGFNDQVHFMDEVLKEGSGKYIITQYTSRLISDAPINENNYGAIKKKYPNLYYDRSFSDIDTPSQYLVELVDNVVTASSSVGIQSMIWEKDLEVIGDTYLKSYSYRNVANELDWSEVCQNTLGFTLNYHQPLYSSVTEDFQFLYSLLTKLIERKNNLGLDRLVPFIECSSKYNQILLNSFRYNAASKVISTNFPESKQDKVLNEFRILVNNKNVKAISFDVFDTLIDRPFEKPVDLFKFMENEVASISNGMINDFSKIRPFCEVETRKILSQEEITLSDIYDTLQEYYGVSDELIEKVKNFEVRSEVSCVSRRGMGQILYNIASDSKKPVYLISDMYLSKNIIEEMLDKCGFNTHEKLYVSSEYLVRKHSGLLFDLFLQENQLKPQNLLHVGDNKKTDITVPSSRGIHTFRWSSAIEWLRVNPKLKEVYHPRKGAGEKPRSVLAGLTAREMFDKPLDADIMKSVTDGTPISLGYTVLGPLVLGYVSWIARQAKEAEVSKIFFLAREGGILKQVYDYIYSNQKDYPQSEYLYASRRVVRVANIKVDSDIASLIAAPYDPGVPLVQLLESRFGLIVDTKIKKVIKGKGISETKILTRSLEDRLIFSDICHNLSNLIFDNSKLEREDYLAYLDKVGFMNEERPLVVDIGWKTNIQGDLGLLTGKSILGCYYATLQGSEKWLAKGNNHKHLGYYGTNISPEASNSALISNRHLIEFLLCAPHKSIVKVCSKNGEFYPVYQNEENHEARKKFTINSHLGVINFSKAYVKSYIEYIDQIYIDPELAEKAFSVFCDSPSDVDAKLLLGLSFEDALGGVKQKFIISPDSNGREQSVWKKGFDIYYSDNHSKNTSKASIKNSLVDTEYKIIQYERFVLRKIVSEQKFNKLMRDRNGFFLDSNRKLSKYYLQFTKSLTK